MMTAALKLGLEPDPLIPAFPARRLIDTAITSVAPQLYFIQVTHSAVGSTETRKQPEVYKGNCHLNKRMINTEQKEKTNSYSISVC